jgi:ribulose-5-phosphate 4-epimerase/fuculose-1-phosphate aldolase
MSDTEAVKQAKIDLTCALRTASAMGLSEGICNHFSYRVPGGDEGPEHFLINPQGVYWAEMVPSDIVTVDVNGNRVAGNRPVEPTAFFIHSRVHRHKKNTRCVMHTHMPYTTSLTLIENGRLEWCNQNALRFFGRVAYDDVYNGLALDEAEGDRICGTLGNADVLFMANHGIILCGENIAHTFDDLYYLERSAMVQVLAQSTGKKLKIVPDDVAALAAAQSEQERQQSRLHFDALKRQLDKTDPGWSER